jgi:hypothetical protein
VVALIEAIGSKKISITIAVSIPTVLSFVVSCLSRLRTTIRSSPERASCMGEVAEPPLAAQRPGALEGWACGSSYP